VHCTSQVIKSSSAVVVVVVVAVAIHDALPEGREEGVFLSTKDPATAFTLITISLTGLSTFLTNFIININ